MSSSIRNVVYIGIVFALATVFCDITVLVLDSQLKSICPSDVDTGELVTWNIVSFALDLIRLYFIWTTASFAPRELKTALFGHRTAIGGAANETRNAGEKYLIGGASIEARNAGSAFFGALHNRPQYLWRKECGFSNNRKSSSSSSKYNSTRQCSRNRYVRASQT